MLPSDLNAEAAILSAMMNDESCLPIAMEYLEEEYFFDGKHKKIFNIMVDLFDNNVNVDVITIINKIKQKKYAIENSYIDQISDVAYSGNNIKHHIDIVVEKFQLRDLMIKVDMIKSDCHNQDKPTSEILDNAKKMVLNVGVNNENTVHRTHEIINKTLDTIEINCSHDDGYGIKTGQPDLDEVLGVIKPHHYVIISAPSGCGKTIEACQIAWHNAFVRKKNVIYFAYEMSYDELFLREISRQTRIRYEQLENGWLSPDNHDVIAKVTEKMSKANIIIDDKTGQSIEELRSKLMLFKNEMDIDLVIVDFIQMGKMGKADKRHEALTEYSRGIKAINKDLGFPIIVTAQVNSDGELSESKNMIQPADKHFHISRPDYEGKKKIKIDGIFYEEPPKNFASFTIRKNRAGKTGRVKMEFNGDNQEFISWENKY